MWRSRRVPNPSRWSQCRTPPAHHGQRRQPMPGQRRLRTADAAHLRRTCCSLCRPALSGDRIDLVADELEQVPACHHEGWHRGLTRPRVGVQGEHRTLVEPVAAEQGVPGPEEHLYGGAIWAAEGCEGACGLTDQIFHSIGGLPEPPAEVCDGGSVVWVWQEDSD